MKLILSILAGICGIIGVLIAINIVLFILPFLILISVGVGIGFTVYCALSYKKPSQS